MTDATELRRGYEHCFGCGPDNPIGLGLDGFTVEGDRVTASFVPRTEYQGFGGVLHGGVVATALDEILAWTGILVAGSPVVTARLSLRYRKPAPVDARFDLAGWIVSDRGRRIELAGECRSGGVLVASAEGLFIRAEGSTDYVGQGASA